MDHLVLLAVLSLAACGTSEPQVTVESAPTVAAEGQRYDPPVELAEIPAGAWVCDMGTVHFAAGDKHPEPCPVCGMKLTLKE